MNFSIREVERLIPAYVKDVSNGKIPVIDLSGYDYFNIEALGQILIFLSAVKENKYWTYEKPDEVYFPLIYPSNIKRLYNYEFFKFSCIKELFIKSSDFARDEDRLKYINKNVLPFSVIVRSCKSNAQQYEFENECSKFINKLVDVFINTLENTFNYSHIQTTGFLNMFNEIVGNIYKHSNSWGMCAIDCNITKSRMIIYIADIGIGMKKTLDPVKHLYKQYPDNVWNDNMAINMAFKKTVTSMPGKSRGIGLYDVKDYVLNNGGSIICRSGCGFVKYYSDGKIVQKDVTNIPGVQMKIELIGRNR